MRLGPRLGVLAIKKTHIPLDLRLPKIKILKKKENSESGRSSSVWPSSAFDYVGLGHVTLGTILRGGHVFLLTMLKSTSYRHFKSRCHERHVKEMFGILDKGI